MTNHRNRSRFTVIISDQYLTGDSPEGFNTDKWIAALTREYRRVVRAHFPNALCIVKIDVQRASGYSRPVSIDYEHDSRVLYNDQSMLRMEIEQASNALYDSRGQEFYA
jgi:hypothetical protein